MHITRFLLKYLERMQLDEKAYKKAAKFYHDFYLERPRLVEVMGYGKRRPIYTVYLIIIYIYFIFITSMAVCAMYLASPQKNLVIGGLHVIMNASFATWGLSTRWLCDKALAKLRRWIQEGIFLYKDEDVDTEQVRIKEDGLAEIRSMSRKFCILYVCGGFTNAIIFPLSQYIMVKEEQYEEVVDLANPYLPAFFYLPFSTRTTKGFICAYLIHVFIPLLVDGSAIAANDIFLSTVLQLNIQLRILNHSIKNVHKRAYLMYTKKANVPRKDISVGEISGNLNYQECLYKCLRSNIEHHHVLLRYRDEVLKYSGSFLLLLVFIAAITFASNLYLIMQIPAINLLINCLLTLMVEQTYVLYMCYFGELVMRESEQIFESLYSVPWFYYNKSFNKALQVFMCFTRQPMRIKALFLDLTASLETYADFLSTMYKVVNILKQSDTI